MHGREAVAYIEYSEKKTNNKLFCYTCAAFPLLLFPFRG